MKTAAKKAVGVLLSALVLAGMLNGCTKSPASNNEGSDEANPSTQAAAQETSSQSAAQDQTSVQETEPAQAGMDWKIGIGIVTSTSGSKDAGEGDGSAQCYSIMAAVLFDETGVIRNCVIDAAQTTLGFSSEGKVTADLGAVYPTKNQLGDEYGMHNASSIGKEWNEQAAAFAQYCTGKTVEQVIGLELTENKIMDADIISSVTIKVNDFIRAIEKASVLALPVQASENAVLKLETATDVSASKDASNESEGQCQAYNTYIAAAVNPDGVITGCCIDSTQATVTFDASGIITSDLTAEVLTKNELGDTYGMKKASSIGKEWWEQAAGFAAWCTGKTVAEVAGMEMADGKATDADVLASATVHINGWVEMLSRMAN